MSEEKIIDYIKAIDIGMAEKGVRTQKELSKLSKVSETTLSLILKGKSNPSRETIEKISISLGYLVSEFSALGERRAED